jgi:uncharacterized membrane protein SirB2
MGEYLVWYLITVAVNLIIAGVTMYREQQTGGDITLKIVSITALIIFTPYLNTVLLIVGLLMLVVALVNEAFDWLGEKFDTVVLFKGKGK